jgi:ATP-binding cassette, subfamily B, bacterial PglK
VARRAELSLASTLRLKKIMGLIASSAGLGKKTQDLLARFYNFYGYKCKKELAILFIGAVVSGVIELMGLILLYVLIRVMIGMKSEGFTHWSLSFFNFLGLHDKSFIIPIFGAGILCVFLLKNIYIMFYYHLQHLILRKWRNGISNFLMERYLFSPYTFLLGYNSATVIRNVNSTVSAALNGFVLASLNYSSNIITGLVILSLLYLQYTSVTILMATILVTSTVLQNRFLKQKQMDLGKEREMLSSEQTKSVYQGLHALKETKVLGKEKYFLDIFKDINQRSVDNEMKTLFYSRLPAHTTEMVIIFSVLIITVTVLMDTIDNVAISVSSLGVLAAIAFRLAPIMNRTVSALQSMDKNAYSMTLLFAEIDKLLKIPINNVDRDQVTTMPFKSEICLQNIDYVYPRTSTKVLKENSLSIKKGEFIGIVGSSGAGKSTMVDIILGLLEPTKGNLAIDGEQITKKNVRNWQKNIGYVPQEVYISDGSIKENVAFGIKPSEVDEELLNKVLEMVKLDEYVANNPDGTDYIVGENGRNLSGGQKQRIGIARALYLKANVLILDEATSALDVPTEVEVSNAINAIRGEKTILMIAHRLSTVFDADKIIFIDNGKIMDIGTYKELFNRNEEFNRLGRMAKVVP